MDPQLGNAYVMDWACPSRSEQSFPLRVTILERARSGLSIPEFMADPFSFNSQGRDIDHGSQAIALKSDEDYST